MRSLHYYGATILVALATAALLASVVLAPLSATSEPPVATTPTAVRPATVAPTRPPQPVLAYVAGTGAGGQPTVTTTRTPVPTIPQTATATPSPLPTVTATATHRAVTEETPAPSPATPAPEPVVEAGAPAPSVTPVPPLVSDGVARTLAVPILMYHYISDPPPGADKWRPRLSVSAALFRNHLAWLRQNGYTTITLRELADALANGAPLPERPIALTFDDGYADHYTQAFPLLREFGMRGTFFIITGLTEERNVSYVSWEQVAEMQQAGMEIGSHTRDHAALPGKPAEFIVGQLTDSAELMTARLGRRPTVFAYPSGRFDLGVIHLTAQTGYEVAVVTVPGMIHTSGNLMTLKRLRVGGGMDAAGLATLLAHWRNRGQ